jgi:large repetitive protein
MSTGTGVNVSKANAYVVLNTQTALNVSKANAYVVLVMANSNPPVWPAFTFANGVVGVPYSQSFDLAPAAAPTTYTVASGALPPGLLLTNGGGDVGTVSGTPTLAGTFLFSLTATNLFGSATKAFSITVVSPPLPSGGGNYGFSS